MASIDVHLTADELNHALCTDVRRGLTSRPKVLPPKYFYDAHGSDLFEAITRLPEYYPTRAEAAILEEHSDDIAKLSAARTLVELGSGSSEKTQRLLDALGGAGTLERYVPVDVSAGALEQAVQDLGLRYPGLEVHGMVADFERHLGLLPTGGPRLIAFLGGTIGNFVPAERAKFLAALGAEMQTGDALLLGTDLVKDPGRLVAAYDDSAGVTADFNRNVLRVVNRELGADFVPESFEHVAVWDAEQEWIEMRLRSVAAQVVHVSALGLTVDFAAGEEMRTEVSAKFRHESMIRELDSAGLRLEEWWTDDPGDFALSLSIA